MNTYAGKPAGKLKHGQEQRVTSRNSGTKNRCYAPKKTEK